MSYSLVVCIMVATHLLSESYARQIVKSNMNEKPLMTKMTPLVIFMTHTCPLSPPAPTLSPFLFPCYFLSHVLFAFLFLRVTVLVFLVPLSMCTHLPPPRPYPC